MKSGTRKQARDCRHKKNFKNFEAAQAHTGWMNTTGRRVKPYQCEICNGWHICSQDKLSILTELFKKIEKQRLEN